MSKSLANRYLPLLAVALTLAVAGCHNNQNQAPANAGQDNAQQQGPDPAAVNLAPASYTTSPSADSGAPVPQPSSPSDQSYASGPPPSQQADDDSGYSEPATTYAPDAPPALPSYDQPPDPGDGDIWTPGYWAWASSGYYWVPGAWVQPPYAGALWTPGYWSSTGGRYGFHPGHWGSHMGYYGGINYGFGYTGLGYEGGYWKSGQFEYNRVYNNVNTSVVHNVYSYDAGHRNDNAPRVSYHGGSGGVPDRPRPQEMSAAREPIVPRMNSQVQNAQSYRSNRNQFASVTHNQPQSLATNRPLQADPNVHRVQPSWNRNPGHGNPSQSTPERGNPGQSQPNRESGGAQQHGGNQNRDQHH